MIVVDRPGHVSLSVTNAKKRDGRIDSPSPCPGCSRIRRRFRATIIVAELNVHHSRDRIRAISSRRAILQDLDALNRGCGMEFRSIKDDAARRCSMG